MELLSDRELAEETLRVLRSLDSTLARFLGAFSQGGARGVRTAARELAGQFERRQPDGTWKPITPEQAMEGGWGK